ncbi:2'-5' RNA ligase family protein [Ruegeria sp.]|uniref:2'-5' RNA ligase family protein n=1 Tax=Ruegeria sp. TaxID=1879320 RepID=UPI0023138190|nr:2'-5' RNA ligase family protein [Ruegeria sp.]MDA7964375.1 2'-5' RNA ligase family protein [Ruegeria sp.]
MIYVLAYPEFEPSCAGRIRSFRAKHEPQRAKLVPPHITLVFGVKDEHLQTITELVEAVSNQTHEFPIAFDDHAIEFDPFEQKYKIFLLCGDGSCTVTALHDQLYNGEHRTELNSTHPFRPHMTIATYDERAEIERLDVSDAGELPICGKLRALEIMRFSNGELSTLKTVPFRQ